MITALWIVVGVVAAGVIFLATVGRGTPEPLATTPAGVLDRLLRENVVVTLKTGETFGGVLWERDDRALVLRAAYLVGGAEKGENLPVDGELLLYVDTVSYWQKP